MSILGFLLKPKKEMAKKNTKRVRMGKYTITRHAQNRIVEPARNLKKKDMIINLFGRLSKNSNSYIYKDGIEQYDRINENNRTVTHITKKDNMVKTIQKYHSTKNGKRYAYKNFK